MNKFKIRVKKRLTDELARIKSFSSDFYKGEQEGINFALYAIDSIDEPEKPVLTEEEAEWVDKLTDSFSVPNALYYITRCGYGHLFNFEMRGKTYELPVDSSVPYGEVRKLRERLVNAVIYGYEVKKEKLYTAKLKATNEYLYYDKDYREIYHIKAYDDTANQAKGYHFTKDSLVKYNAWKNEAYDVKEVEE